VVREVIKLAMGEEPDLRTRQKKGAVLLFFKNIPGKIKEITGVEKARKIKGIYEIEVYVKPGDVIKPLTCGDDRIGHTIAFGETREEAVRAAKMAERSIRFVVENRAKTRPGSVGGFE
jgi:biotin carboxylase